MPVTIDTSIAKTSLLAVKRAANISLDPGNYDDTLNEYVNIASAKITSLLDGRELVATDYVQWLDGNGEGEFVVPQYPLLRVNLLATGRSTSMTARYTGAGVRATAQVTDTGLRLTSWGTSGVVATDVAWASYETVGEVVTQINDNVADWTAVLLTDNPSKWLAPQGGRDAKTAAVDIDAPDTFDHEYEVRTGPGLIQFTGWRSSFGDFDTDAGLMRPTHGMGLGTRYKSGSTPFGGLAILADYRAGYETIPADIEQVARDMAVTMFRTSYRDGSVKSESLGGYSYTLADKVGESGEYDSVLNKYKREVIA